MEYCNGGSLATLIEEPENMYGLQQEEFLLVLKHISKIFFKVFSNECKSSTFFSLKQVA
jgi:hypothetical protein